MKRPLALHALPLAALMVAAAAPVQANDLAKGKEKHEQVCAACHGKDAASPIDPSYPILAGQYPDYVEHALKAYKSGERKNAIMGGIAKGLSKTDIENLASYYASLHDGPLRYKAGSVRTQPQQGR